MRARFESFESGPLLYLNSVPSPRISKQHKRRGLMAIHLPQYLRNDLFFRKYAANFKLAERTRFLR